MNNNKVKKFLSILLVCIMAVSSLVGCSQGSSSDESGNPVSEKPDKVYELKWGHVSAPSHAYHIAAEKVAKEVFDATNGQVNITIFPSSQLGTQREMTESIHSGVIDIVNSSSSVLSGFVPRLQVLDLPFIFKDRAHIYKIMDGEIGKEIFDGVEEAVGPVIAIWDNGIRDLWMKDRVVKTPNDIAGLKLRVMESKAYIRMAECLGANATPMAYSELYTALQQGTVDGADGPVPNAYSEKFYEVTPYITLTEHAYSASPVLVSPFLKDKIGEENYNILIQAIKDNTDYQREVSETQEKDFSDLLVKEGVEIYRPTAEERQLFVDSCKPVWDEFADVVGQDLIDKIVAAAE